MPETQALTVDGHLSMRKQQVGLEAGRAPLRMAGCCCTLRQVLQHVAVVALELADAWKAPSAIALRVGWIPELPAGPSPIVTSVIIDPAEWRQGQRSDDLDQGGKHHRITLRILTLDLDRQGPCCPGVTSNRGMLMCQMSCDACPSKPV